MRTGWLGLLLAVMVLSGSPVVLAQQAGSRPAGATPDISGVWNGPVGGGGGGGLTGLPGIGRRRWREALPPLQPWAAAILRANRQGVTDPNEQGLDSLDPNNNCIPPGMPRIYAVARPFDVEDILNHVAAVEPHIQGVCEHVFASFFDNVAKISGDKS